VVPILFFHPLRPQAAVAVTQEMLLAQILVVQAAVLETITVLLEVALLATPHLLHHLKATMVAQIVQILIRLAAVEAHLR
jgi:hypothetical protein